MKLAQTNLPSSRRDSLKIARRFNAGIRLVCASSPAGTAEPARQFRPSLPSPLRFDATSRDLNRFAAQPGVKTPGYCHPSLLDKTKTAQVNLRGLERAEVPFPLTLTLSLGEREQRSARSGFSSASFANTDAGFRVRRDTILPLPKGEGRGEGKGGIQISAREHSPVANGARLWSETQPQRVASTGRVGNFVSAAAGALHTAALQAKAARN